VATHELSCPFGHVARGIAVLDHITEWGGCHDHNGVPLKVVQQLSFGDEDGVDKLLDLRVTHLSVREYCLMKYTSVWILWECLLSSHLMTSAMLTT
jgi:hypothetical protein